MFHRKVILKKSIKIGLLTQISRFLGLARDLLIARYLGIGTWSDAFITAFKVPNALRKVFAEGALSATLIPSLVKATKDSQGVNVSQLMAGAFLFFEGLCFTFVVVSMYYAHNIVHVIASGFTEVQKQATGQLLFILMPYILFISISYLFGGFLQSQGHFLIHAAGPAIGNILFLLIIALSFYLKLSITTFCMLLVASAFLLCLINVITYFHSGFSIKMPDKKVLPTLKHIARQFILCLPSVSFSEINLFIDTSFASTLETGSISLLYYANRFMGIPLGVVVGSLTTVLLPQFSHIALTSKKKLSFYIFESIKLIMWITIPITLLMILFSYPLFYTLFFSKYFSSDHIKRASVILQMFSIGLPALALNRLFLNVLYALDKHTVPAFISIVAVCVNVICNYLFLETYKTAGLALATSISAYVQMFLFICILRYYECKVYEKKVAVFLIRYLIQLTKIGIPIIMVYYFILKCMPHNFMSFYSGTWWGFWVLGAPLSLVFCICIFLSRKHAGFYSFFID